MMTYPSSLFLLKVKRASMLKVECKHPSVSLSWELFRNVVPDPTSDLMSQNLAQNLLLTNVQLILLLVA